MIDKTTVPFSLNHPYRERLAAVFTDKSLAEAECKKHPYSDIVIVEILVNTWAKR